MNRIDGMKIGIIGTGQVASNSYLPALSKHDIELLYFNRTAEKAAACAARFGGRVCPSLASLLAHQPDAVLLLTKETDRYDAACAALSHRPKRLFFEKPLVARHGQGRVVEEDFEQARDLLQRARAAGTETAMVFNYRFFDHILRARAWVAERDVGRPLQAVAHAHYACWSHTIDLLLHFSGPAATVAALEGCEKRGEGEFHSADRVAAIGFAGGAVGTLAGTSGASFDLPLLSVTFLYERAMLRMTDLDAQLEFFGTGEPAQERFGLPAGKTRWDQYEASFGKAVDAYLAGVRAGAPPPVPGLAGLRELQVEAALVRSAREGRPVELESEFRIRDTLQQETGGEIWTGSTGSAG